jgi:hypothetical protein
VKVVKVVIVIGLCKKEEDVFICMKKHIIDFMMSAHVQIAWYELYVEIDIMFARIFIIF